MNQRPILVAILLAAVCPASGAFQNKSTKGVENMLQTNKDDSDRATSAVERETPQKQENQGIAISANTGQSVRVTSLPPVSVSAAKDLWDKALVIFTGLIVIVGIFQIYFLWSTVEATKKNADALIASERAWILAEVNWRNGKGHVMEGRSNVMGQISTSTGAHVELVCKNEGSGPAWITEKRMGFAIMNNLPVDPPLDSAEIMQAGREPLGIGNVDDPVTKDTTLTIAQGTAGTGDVSVIFGVVKYEDTFGKKRATTFGYRITPSMELKRLEGEEYRKYNESL